jgi:hypothetical protein
MRQSVLRLRVCLVVLAAGFMLAPAGAAAPGAAPPRPTLVVVVVGGGRVTSRPAGISCPGRCRVTFARSTRVVLKAKAKKGSRFLRWGGSCKGAGSCSVRVSALAAVAAQFQGGTKPPPSGGGGAAAKPGSYSGQNGQNGNGFTLYVAPGGKNVLNITDPLTGLACTSFGAGDHLRILKTAIAPNGSFKATATQKGLFQALAATFTYTVTGRFQAAGPGGAATAAGTWRENIVTSDPSMRCTSNDQSWSVTRGAGAIPQKPVIEPGNYSGSNGQNGNGFFFSVTGDRKTMTNVSDPLTGLTCTPARGLGDRLRFLEIPINGDGSFSATATQDGLIGGASAKFTYTVAGYFEGMTPFGAATVEGTWREDIVFADGSSRTCTSNNQSWTATRS